MYRILVNLLALLSVSLSVQSQESITWVEWEEGINKSTEENKKIIVDLYTQWCGWCKKMDKTTFRDSLIIDYINENYIAIKFDAEHRGDIEFQGNIYKFTKGGLRGYHSLAAKMTHGKLRYPTIVFLNEEAQVIQALPGFQNAGNLEKILNYFAEDHHKTTRWSTFRLNYKSPREAMSRAKKNNNTRLVSGKGI